jgi:hypothetical protein
MPSLLDVPIKNPIANMNAGTPLYDGGNGIMAEMKC